MALDQDICYRALSSRDRRFDGRFFTGVSSTGVYCRPVCPARTPKRRNCTFFPSAAAAEEAGYRPCLRCRPETSPGTPAWLGSSATVSRALRLIGEGALDHAGVEELAARLGVGSRHLRRLFDRELGASPLAVAQTRRVHFAKQLLDETFLPMGHVALAAGFPNVRRFNAAMRKSYGRSPTELRRRAGTGPAQISSGPGSTGSFPLRLAYRPPYDWEALVSFLAPRAIPGVEQFDEGVYRRTVTFGSAAGIIEVRPVPAASCFELRAPVVFSSVLLPITERVRELFDLGADLEPITRQLSADPQLAPCVRARPGLRLPGAWDRFELAIRAILGQQVSVKGATTLAGRIVRAFGEPLVGDPRDPEERTRSSRFDLRSEKKSSGEGRLTHLFPTPEALAEADLAAVGLPRSRAETIRRLAMAVREGELELEFAAGLEEAVQRLIAVPGIGAWTAQYIAMRALREPDAFPASDLGLLRAVGSGSEPMTPRALTGRAEAWRPWRAYAAMHIWMSERMDRHA